MDQRFVRVWRDMDVRRLHGEPLDRIVAEADDAALVAALAAAAREDPVAANVLATELLNRVQRAPFFGAFLVSATTVFLIYFLDWLFTGSILILESGARAHILVAISALISLVSLACLQMWRGRLRRLRFALRLRQRHY